jgi:signal transduction histidine kinase
VTIAVKKEAHQVLFVIEDNGRGFNLDEVLRTESVKRKVGLVAMAERVNMMGGSLTIWSREGRGARITFTVPFAAEEEAL